MNARALRENLMQSFPSNQATVLADAFTEAFAAQDRVFEEMGTLRREVTRMAQEVTQLAEAQGRLAEAQGRTEMRVEQLAEAQGRTEMRVEQLAEAQGRTETAVQNLARQVGGLSEKLGGSLEDLAIETVPAVLSEEWGLSGIDCARGTFQLADREVEVDLFLRGTTPKGTELVVLGEVKSRLTAREAEHFLALVEKIRPTLPNPEVRVLFFGFQIGLDARRIIREAGAYFLFSNGRFLKTL